MSDKKSSKKVTVNREKTCPLLLRMFCSNGKHHDPHDFINGSTPTSSSELQIYTWMDANLEELTNLIQEVNPDCRTRGTVFDFRIVYPDLKSDRYRMKVMGTVVSGVTNEDNSYTLKDKHFQIGDYIDVAIIEPVGGSNYLADLANRTGIRPNKTRR